MAYGFHGLESQLIDLFRSGPPDFQKAEELIAQGADLNAVSTSSLNDNVLSSILEGYWLADKEVEIFTGEINGDSYDYAAAHRENRMLGTYMEQIVRFFLDHGFDVHKNNGQFGAECLWVLTLSIFSRNMLTAAKMLLDAGAQNISVEANDSSETPKDFAATEGSYQDCCEHNHHLGNVFEALYQIYEAVDHGRPYNGIDSYECSVGKTIRKVLAERPVSGIVFYDLNLPHFKHKNCFNQTLYFVFDDNFLVVTKYASFWVDNNLPETALVDVSKRFPDLIGSQITGFEFDHREIVKGTTHYGQPVVTIKTSSGVDAVFSINFGEVENKDRAGFYTLVYPRTESPLRDFIKNVIRKIAQGSREIF